MSPEQASALADAIFGDRAGEMANITRHPEVCAAFQVAFPEAPLSWELRDEKSRRLLGDCLKEWGIALTQISDEEIPF